MRQSTGAMIVKIVIGLLFIICGLTSDFSSAENPALTIAMSLCIGLGLLAWGLIPWFKARKAKADAAAAAEKMRQEAEYQRMNTPKVCPACGAYTKGIRCEYCGSPLSDD